MAHVTGDPLYCSGDGERHPIQTRGSSSRPLSGFAAAVITPMHDIGKIGIPDHILLKPGRFEPAEREIINTHTTIGAKLLDGDDSPLLKLAREIALSHHEKWDGSGYPNGLAGEAIPQSGRIVAVADVFDALTAARPYKKAWTVEDATKFVRDNAGSHFDTAVVDCFIEILPDILVIRNQYPEHYCD